MHSDEYIAQMIHKRHTSFHMPGHKGKLLPYEMDVTYDTTELLSTDDLYAPQHGILKAQVALQKSAKSFGSIMLTGGSTAGLLSAILYASQPGDNIVVPRNVHNSVISGTILSGANPIWVNPSVDASGLCFTHEADILSRINESRAVACVITRPDYYGRCLELSNIIKAAHQKGMLVIVDEAHGAHFNWGIMPSAGALGADIWVQSAHKTLPCLTGGAWLHHASTVDGEKLLFFLRLVMTSSPSFLIMQSLDSTRSWMDEYGKDALNELARKCAWLYSEIRSLEQIKICSDVFKGQGLECDFTRIVLDVSALGMTGYRAQELLAKQGIEPEMADERRIVAIASVMDDEEDFSCLFRGLKTLCDMDFHKNVLYNEVNAGVTMPIYGQRMLDLRTAALSKTKLVPLDDAKGHIASTTIGIYPPGIPWIMPGEEISVEISNALSAAAQAGAAIFGVNDGKVRIVEDTGR